MPRIFDNIELGLLPALRETLVYLSVRTSALVISTFAVGRPSTTSLKNGRAARDANAVS
jgi:hypothetical protein